MNELALFAGAGGGILGTKLLGWRVVGYVEINKYCQAVLAQRITDGLLDAAPIFGDIRKFISEGYASAYQGMVDVVTAGFPCQPWSSTGGKRRGERDTRNLWPCTIECIRIIQPQYAFLENVTGLLTHQYIRRIFGDLAEAGYDARWCVLGADDCGYHHRRKRLWILAFPHNSGWIFREDRPKGYGNYKKRSVSFGYPETSEEGFGAKVVRFSMGDRWATIKADIRGSDDGVANRVDRLKALGEGQVPVVVRAAWELLR